MCALMVSRGRQANPVLTYTTALRRFLGCRIMKPHFGGFTSVSPQEMTILWQKWKNAVFYSQKMII